MASPPGVGFRLCAAESSGARASVLTAVQAAATIRYPKGVRNANVWKANEYWQPPAGRASGVPRRCALPPTVPRFSPPISTPTRWIRCADRPGLAPPSAGRDRSPRDQRTGRAVRAGRRAVQLCGLCPFRRCAGSGEDEYDFAFDLNVKSMFHTIRAVLPGMIAQGGGAIVNMSSVAGPIKSPPNRCIYSMTKAAVAALTGSVAVTLSSSASAPMRFAPAPLTAPACKIGCGRRAIMTRPARHSWHVSRWGGLARRKRSQPLPPILPATKVPLPQGRHM